MRYISLFVLCGFLFACKAKKDISQTEPEDNVSVQIGGMGALELELPSDHRFSPLPSDGQHQYILGILEDDGRLNVNGERKLLTRISMQAAASPESETLNLNPEDFGKYVIVKGMMGGDIYEAALVCVFEEEFSSELLKDFQEGRKNMLDYCK